MKNYPRFSANLRSRTGLEILKLEQLPDFDYIKVDRNRINSSAGKPKYVLASSSSESKFILKDLRNALTVSLGEGDAEATNDAIIFLLHLYKHQGDHSIKINSVCRALLDKCSNQVFDILGKVFEHLNEEDWNHIEQHSKDMYDKEPKTERWGSEISFGFSESNKSSVPSLLDIYTENCSKHILSNLSMAYKSNVKEGCSEQHIFKVFEGGDFDIVKKVLHLLKSKKNDSEIQNSLCEVIGFDNFETVMSILANRKIVAEKLQQIEKLHKFKNLEKRTFEKRPTVATSVIVQSVFEKDITKQNRRDEKKLNRLLKNDEKMSNHLHTTINPLQLRLQQQKKLIEYAKQQPILRLTNIVKATCSDIPNYPYVFDSQMLAKQHAAFIGGTKINLPESAERIDTKQYEEIKIPAQPLPDLQVGKSRIHIKDLDDICQLAFRNTEQLNRLQSVVFPTAYQTNHNLLICAPTGAGKTNIAMLTIIATIRSHLENGTINRDSFKIVYVAPMKALASEIVDNFQSRLKPLHITVRELTGDMQLTKTEMLKTQVLVTTPEKWDVVTRKGVNDLAIISLVKLLIIDEVHLLHGDRGPVVEALVARTLRLVESSQSMIRIVGLSATLPNYIDVAHFLRVNPMKGLFYFDSRFRPVPLDTNFIGVKSIKPLQQISDMDSVCYNKCVEMVQKGHQVMVFVHARNATIRTASMLREMAQQKNQACLFVPTSSPEYKQALHNISKNKNKQIVDLFQSGFGIHHAGLLRTDRRLVEKLYAEGFIKVLVCTATLAWGVNLPAHAVIIKGTDIYDSKHGSFIDLGILDVLQIFGRAGRPQYDTSGVGTIITTHDKLNHYLSLLTNQFPIESNFIQCLADNLNAEIASGTVTDIEEAIEWLSYTYLFVRMRINPPCYGIDYKEIHNDPLLENKRRALITTAAINLDKAKMIRYNNRTDDLSITELGRTASHFYIKYDTVETFNELLKPFMTEADIFSMISQAQEFQQLKVRDDELEELDELRKFTCRLTCHASSDGVAEKVNILLQSYLSKGFIKMFSLVSDMSYIVQNVVRIARAIFTIVLRQNNAILAGRMLQVCQMFERQMWNTESPLRQFKCISSETIDKVEYRGLSVYTIKEMNFAEIRDIIRNQKNSTILFQCANELPILEIDVELQPITRTVLRLSIDLSSNFSWNDAVHGKTSENFWLWIEDPETNFIYHWEFVQILKKTVIGGSKQNITITIPLRQPLPSQYFVRITSDTWLGSKTLYPLSFKHLILPEHNPPLTDLLSLQPLPVSVLKNSRFEALYPFSHFNPIQTQIFHNLYHTDNNILLGAPTGSGKTIVAELAIFREFQKQKSGKVVYIAPLKALVKERINDWKIRFENNLKKNVVELTGDTSPDTQAIQRSQVIVTTPEKWDSISRSWQTREYVKDVALIIIDEIHLLGEDRGPVIEVIVSRTRFITSITKNPIRIIGLSTALANAQDLANWLGIRKAGLYNFKPSVRPVPLSVHINGFSGKHYCPRMATMNRPAYQAIRTYSPTTPSIVFVSSRRQTRLTALDLITYVAGDDDPKRFLKASEMEIQEILYNVKDSNLKFCLAFGIGLHHAGLCETDRKIVEDLFLKRKIQVLIATATLAWGINLPAHLVVIKGTEYFDSKTKKYVDMPITDVLQMMGRAGRPQFDNEGVAVVFVHDIKKNFYKKFLYDPFPVESSLLNVLPDHLNAEIVSGTVQTKEAAVDYLTWTYFFRRLLRNPIYYSLETVEDKNINMFLSLLIEKNLSKLEDAGCLSVSKNALTPTFLGRISSFYYLSHCTMKHFVNDITEDMSVSNLLSSLSDCYEFHQQPVRHNEDSSNEELAKLCRYKPKTQNYDSPYLKTFLLLQAHIMRLPLPNSDYLTDTKSVLDQALRVLQAMIDYTAERGWLCPTLRLQNISQSVIQARWFDEPVFLTLPHVTDNNVDCFYEISNTYEGSNPITLAKLKDIVSSNYARLDPLRKNFDEIEIEHIHKVIKNFPEITVELYLQQCFEEQNGPDIPIDVEKPVFRDINVNEAYTICVNLFRRSSVGNSDVFCPRYPKPKNEGWFLTLGSQTNNVLLAMKRIAIGSKSSTHRLCFQSPPRSGKVILTIYIMSDCYIGLDQQFNIYLNVI